MGNFTVSISSSFIATLYSIAVIGAIFVYISPKSPQNKINFICLSCQTIPMQLTYTILIACIIACMINLQICEPFFLASVTSRGLIDVDEVKIHTNFPSFIVWIKEMSLF